MWICLRRLLLFGSLLTFLPAAGLAQSAMDLVGSARATALGYATTALPGDIGSQSNPAAATRSSRSLHLFARESYGLDELRRAAADVVVPWSQGAFLAGIGTFGFEAYREWYFSLGGALRWRPGTTRTAHVGLRARYYHTHIVSYGQAGTVGLSLGSQVQLLSTLTFGVLAVNLNAPQLAEATDLPQSLALGLAYEASPGFVTLLDAVKDIDFPLSLRGGFEAMLLSTLVLRAGFTTAPVRFMTGVGFRAGRLAADLAAEQHQTLGWSPSIGLGIRW